jgi:hypothetical protein
MPSTTQIANRRRVPSAPAHSTSQFSKTGAKFQR